MTTQIKHKNGTSNPSSSDFNSVAELLINTADGGLFTKTDGGSVVELGINSDDISLDFGSVA